MKELGIYVHVPFCKSKCNYCSFYSLPTIKNYNYTTLEQYAELLIKELEIESEKYFFKGSDINSIYFGGGTPSLMPISFFKNLLNKIEKKFKIANDAEITAEINPESGSINKLEGMKSLGINRISLGAQSFNDDVLKTAGRTHNEKNIYDAVNNARKAGFNNISIDLIIGLPEQTENVFQNDANKILDIEPEHISAYMLNIEKGTKFYKIYKTENCDNDNENLNEYKNEKNKIYFISEDETAKYYEIFAELLLEKGYAHYEISNFAKTGYESRHNLNYWKRGQYLGLGPSASSFLKPGDGKEIRKTNVSDLAKYADCIIRKTNNENYDDNYSNKNYSFIEILAEKDIINEEIFLSLRTRFGINANKLYEFAGYKVINNFIDAGLMKKINGNIALTLKGMLLSSEIFARLML